MVDGLSGLELEGQLGALEQSLQPPEDLRMGQGQLMIRAMVKYMLNPLRWPSIPAGCCRVTAPPSAFAFADKAPVKGIFTVWPYRACIVTV